jgi:hypothetical protein
MPGENYMKRKLLYEFWLKMAFNILPICFVFSLQILGTRISIYLLVRARIHFIFYSSGRVWRKHAFNGGNFYMGHEIVGEFFLYCAHAAAITYIRDTISRGEILSVGEIYVDSIFCDYY